MRINKQLSIYVILSHVLRKYTTLLFTATRPLQIDPHFPKGITINKPSEHYRYNCTISTFNKTEITTISFTKQDHTKQDSLKSDTTYMVHCIAYDENGSEACFEANGTVKTYE